MLKCYRCGKPIKEKVIPLEKPCPFLTVQTYSTMKGEMKRHYCTARGLKDILPKTTWKNICLKGGICIIRQAQEWLNLKLTQQNLQDVVVWFKEK